MDYIRTALKARAATFYSNITKSSEEKDIQDILQILESVVKDYQNPMDTPITEEELLEKLRTLQPKKACGADAILN
jgi:uncharacterized protein (UPF0147 family)